MKKLFFILVLALGSLSFSEMIDRGGSDEISIYPQPIIKTARVSSDLSIQKIEIYNLLGSKVLERSNQGELDFSELPGGFYLFKIYSEKGIAIKRVQKN